MYRERERFVRIYIYIYIYISTAELSAPPTQPRRASPFRPSLAL